MAPGLNEELTPGKYAEKIRKPKSCLSRCKQTCRELANWLSCLFCRCESHSDVRSGMPHFIIRNLCASVAMSPHRQRYHRLFPMYHNWLRFRVPRWSFLCMFGGKCIRVASSAPGVGVRRGLCCWDPLCHSEATPWPHCSFPWCRCSSRWWCSKHLRCSRHTASKV